MIEITLHGHFEARCDEYGLRTVRNRPRGSSPAPALPSLDGPSPVFGRFTSARNGLLG